VALLVSCTVGDLSVSELLHHPKQKHGTDGNTTFSQKPFTGLYLADTLLADTPTLTCFGWKIPFEAISVLAKCCLSDGQMSVSQISFRQMSGSQMSAS
jgi:hypothetical protein